MAQKLVEQGYKNVRPLSGGYYAWRDAGYPIERRVWLKRRCWTVIRIKRVYDPAEPGDGKRILIDRLWPRGLKKEDLKMDEWLKEIAPSDKLRKWFSHDPKKYEEFKKRYAKELENKSGILARIKTEAKKETVTILFSAKDTEHNNATVLRELLSK